MVLAKCLFDIDLFERSIIKINLSSLLSVIEPFCSALNCVISYTNLFRAKDQAH